jgi:hypothetical protein
MPKNKLNQRGKKKKNTTGIHSVHSKSYYDRYRIHSARDLCCMHGSFVYIYIYANMQEGYIYI